MPAPQADGSSMPSLVSLPNCNTALNTILHQLVSAKPGALLTSSVAFISPRMTGHFDGQGAKDRLAFLYTVS